MTTIHQKVRELNRKATNWVKIHRSVWTEHKNSKDADFLKEIKIEYHQSYLGRDSNGKSKGFKIHKQIHVTGTNFGFTINEKEAECLSQLLSLVAKEFREDKTDKIILSNTK